MRHQTTRGTPVARIDRDARTGLWLMVGGGLLLGTLGVFVEEAGQHPFTTVLARCVFGLLALTVWAAFTGRLRELHLRGQSLALALAAGGLMMVNWSLFFAAIQRTSIGVATVVFHVQPLWVMVLGAWWLQERVVRAQWAAALVALAGLTLASGLMGESARDHASSDHLAGVLMCLGGSLSYALVTLIAKAARGVSSFALAWWQCSVGVVALAWWPFVQGWPQGASTWAWLGGLGVIHTGLAYVVLYAGMSRLPTGRIAVLQFVYPGAAIVMDWVVYGRTLDGWQFVGVGLMGAALLSLGREPQAGRAVPLPHAGIGRGLR